MNPAKKIFLSSVALWCVSDFFLRKISCIFYIGFLKSVVTITQKDAIVECALCFHGILKVSIIAKLYSGTEFDNESR